MSVAAPLIFMSSLLGSNSLPLKQCNWATTTTNCQKYPADFLQKVSLITNLLWHKVPTVPRESVMCSLTTLTNLLRDRQPWLNLVLLSQHTVDTHIINHQSSESSSSSSTSSSFHLLNILYIGISSIGIITDDCTKQAQLSQKAAQCSISLKSLLSLKVTEGQSNLHCWVKFVLSSC